MPPACSVIIPVITIWFGIFPIVVSWWAALGLTVYFVATEMVLYYVRSFKHVEALWFANLANQILFWTYVKVSSRHCHQRPGPAEHSQQLVVQSTKGGPAFAAVTTGRHSG